MNEIFPYFNDREYYLVYKWILGIFIVVNFVLLRIIKSDNLKIYKHSNLSIIVLIMIFTLIFGLRPTFVGVDTGNYYNYFYTPALKAIDFWEVFSILNTDIIFELIMAVTIPFKSFNIFLIIYAFLVNYFIYLFVIKYTQKEPHGNALILFLLFLTSFSYINLEINIIRNGLAISLFLVGYHYLFANNKKRYITFFLLALLSHTTTLIPIALALISRYAKNVKLYYFFAFYFLAIATSAMGFGFNKLPFLSNINNDYFQKLSYTGETSYQLGFRPNFVLYNTFFLFIFYKFCSLSNSKTKSLLIYYVLSSSVFFWNFNIPFSDRVGLYSWIIIPVLLYQAFSFSFPKKYIEYSSLALICFFIINLVILF